MDNILYNFVGDTLIYCANGKTGELIIPNSVTDIAEGAFYSCSSLTSVTIPESVTSIGAGAFSGCNSLASITIPNSVTSIGSWAFGDCDGLQSFTVSWNTPLIVYPLFNTVLNDVTLNVPQGTLAAYQAATVWQDFGTIKEYVVSNTSISTYDNCKVYAQNGSIVVENLESTSSPIHIYDIMGTLHYQQTVSGKVTINVAQNGMYLVRIGTQTRKVLVK